ncbi:MAG: hypothetical protein IJC52_05015, partial [Clostridia bacterium]|nr:hypothetical protein [Clostridia bacterium]
MLNRFRTTLGVLTAAVLLITTLFSLVMVPVAAANTATLTMSSASGNKGDRIEVSLSVGASS